MKIRRISIKGLFDLFDYEIILNDEEKLTIITGPNGFGKTMILNIIYNLFNRRFFFFQKLVFTKIELSLDENFKVEIEKKKGSFRGQKPLFEIEGSKYTEDRSKVIFSFFKKNKIIDVFEYLPEVDDDIIRQIERYIPLQRVAPDRWLDPRTEKVMNLDELMLEYGSSLPEIRHKIPGHFKIKNEEIILILNSINVHLIKEQRLLRQPSVSKRNYSERNQTFLTNTIQEYADDLSQRIKRTVAESFQVSQELDSTFPKRLLEEKHILPQTEFNDRFEILKVKQERLKKYGLSESELEIPEYTKKDAKVLLVYANDTEKKTKIFDDLLDRIELFTNILNERRFTFKYIQIDIEKGFAFYTNKGKLLNLTDLSSGEQHEVVILYELIFNAASNTLVLIDEPEISLHVSWQNDFLKDLMQIIKLKDIQVVIATHSPQIINNNWHLAVDLAKQLK